MIKVEKDLNKIPTSLLATEPKIDSSVREELEKIYHKKCCYCEDEHIKGEVEHYRPQSKYPALKFVWANLLWACHDCNNAKRTQFDENLPIFNPEIDNPENLLEFTFNGEVKSENLRMQKTIETCKLDRENLNDKRKKVYDNLMRNIEVIKELGNKNDVIHYILNVFINNNKELGFIAFRTYIVENHLTSILESLEEYE